MGTLKKEIETDVCIVGAGPAGMLLGLLLARQGINVIVLEKNPDFHREYRGEVTQPRFIQLMKQLNLLDYIESLPHVKIPELRVFHNSSEIFHLAFETLIDDDCYLQRLTQPTLLEAFLKKAQKYPSFHIQFNTKVNKLLKDGEKVIGVFAQTRGEGPDKDGDMNIKAKLTVAVDGRYSTIEKLANFELEFDYYVNDLIWFSFKVPPTLKENLYHFYFQKNFNYLFLPKVGGLIQCGVSMTRGEYAKVKEEGIEAFKAKIVEDLPILKPHMDTVSDFNEFVQLLCKMRYVKDWAKEGCLMIGDAAHCVTPWAGVGSTLAMGSAVVAADVIYKGFMNNDLSVHTLSQVQRRREKEIKMVQHHQVTVEKFLTREPIKKDIAPHMFAIATKLPGVERIFRELFTMDKPLDIDPVFVFGDDE